MRGRFSERFSIFFFIPLILLGGFAVSAWSGPTATAPNGNIAAPVNAGTTDQVKNAGLSVNAITVFGSEYIQNDLGVGQSSPIVALDVNGTVRLASGGEVCQAVTEGAVRYNATAKNAEYCNGTQWCPVTGCPQPPVSCSAIHASNAASPSGVYQIDPDGVGGSAPFDAYCDMTNDGGGWTLVLEGVVGDYAGWNTTGALRVPASPSPTGASFKYADSVIISLVAVGYRVQGGGDHSPVNDTGPFSMKRFAKPTCQYSQTGQGSNCGTTYNDLSWSDPESTEDTVWAGITDWGNSCPNSSCRSFVETARTHQINWLVGNGQIDGTDDFQYCENFNAVSSNCRLTMWVK